MLSMYNIVAVVFNKVNSFNYKVSTHDRNNIIILLQNHDIESVQYWVTIT